MNDEKNWYLELSQYIKNGEESKTEKTKAWEMAIGLQEVDGLKPSKYLIETAKEHIEGNVTIDEVKERINEYYQVSDERKNEEKEECEEADKVSVRIAEILSDKSFNFNPSELINIHKKMFSDIFDHAGIIRNYNFTKKEWVLNGDTVIYSDYGSIYSALEYDFFQESNFSYKDLNLDEAIKHICKFTSNIWQIHPFSEGNTRTTAIFIIKYLRTFGFDINDEVFAKNSWYFRNALVRANYKNFKKNIFEDISYLEKFFYNLLSDTKYDLKNRYTHVDYKNTKSNDLITKNITIEEQAILNMIRENPTIKQEIIANNIGESLRTVKTGMNEMQEKGLIARKNGKKNGI